jgi:hypothetical protein
LHQISPSLLHEILGCVATRISFQISHDDATRLAHELCSGKLAEIAAHLTNLEIGKAALRIGPSEFTIKVPRASERVKPGRAAEVIEHSRKTFGIPRVKASPTIETENQANADEDPLADLDPGDMF